MLIRRAILERIRSGEVTLAFRRWRRATVKTGGTLKTAIGVLAIKRVEQTTERAITNVQARQAGYDDKAALVAELCSREGDVYKITLAYAGADPRIKLRESDLLDDAELTELRERLARMDARSSTGAWTLRVLWAIERNPKLPAGELAQNTGFDKEWLKTNVRKLKNLGLTISHNPGYSISPRGLALLDAVRESEPLKVRRRKAMAVLPAVGCRETSGGAGGLGFLEGRRFVVKLGAGSVAVSWLACAGARFF